MLKSWPKFMKKNWLDFCENTLLPGFRYIGDSSIPIFERLYFLTCVLVILIYVVILTTYIYEKWDSTPVIVGFTANPILINKIPFPTVTICNVNQARASKVRNFSSASVEYSMLQTLCNRPVDHVDPQKLADIESLPRFQQFIEEVAQPCDQLFLSCKFAKSEMNCSDIFRPVFTDEGQCCSFNLLHISFLHRKPRRMEPLVRQDGAEAVDWNPEDGYPNDIPKKFYPRLGAGTGISAGLSVIMNAETDDYYCTSKNGPGFKLLLHNPLEIPSLRENGLYVSAGAESMFRIAADWYEASPQIRNFKFDERQCIFNSERQLAFYKTYSRSNCHVECLANITAKHCGCISYFLPKMVANVSTCSLKQQKCQRQILHWTPEWSALNGEKNCIDVCTQGCFALSYTPARFSIPLTAGGYKIKDQMLEKFNSTYLRKNIAVVHFYYKLSHFSGFMRNRYIGITEFISNTGGLIGLLGFSFISVSEIVYFLIVRSSRVLALRIWNVLLAFRARIKSVRKTPLRPELSSQKENSTRVSSKAYKVRLTNRVSHRY